MLKVFHLLCKQLLTLLGSVSILTINQTEAVSLFKLTTPLKANTPLM